MWTVWVCYPTGCLLDRGMVDMANELSTETPTAGGDTGKLNGGCAKSFISIIRVNDYRIISDAER